MRPPVARPQAVAQARSGVRRVYVATEGGLFVSADGGRRWDRSGPPRVSDADILVVVVDPGDEERLSRSSGISRNLLGIVRQGAPSDPRGQMESRESNRFWVNGHGSMGRLY